MGMKFAHAGMGITDAEFDALAASGSNPSCYLC